MRGFAVAAAPLLRKACAARAARAALDARSVAGALQARPWGCRSRCQPVRSSQARLPGRGCAAPTKRLCRRMSTASATAGWQVATNRCVRRTRDPAVAAAPLLRKAHAARAARAASDARAARAVVGALQARAWAGRSRRQRMCSSHARSRGRGCAAPTKSPSRPSRPCRSCRRRSAASAIARCQVAVPTGPSGATEVSRRRCASYRVQRLSHAFTVSCHCTLLWGLSTQWFSSGKLRNWLGMPCRCSAVNAASPCSIGMR